MALRITAPPHAVTVPHRRRSLRKESQAFLWPRWLVLLDAIHRTAREPIPIAADIAAMTLTGVAVGMRGAEAFVLAAGVTAFLYASGGYADRGPLETQGVLWLVPRAVTPTAIVALTAVAVNRQLGHSITGPLFFGPAAVAALVALRALCWMVILRARRKGLGLRRTLVVGGGSKSHLVETKLAAYPEAGLLPVSTLPLENCLADDVEGARASARKLMRVVQEAGIDEVVLAPEDANGDILNCVKTAEGLEANFSLLPPLSDLFLHPGLVTQVGGLPLIQLGRIARSRTRMPGKRLLDVCVSAIALIALAPVAGIIILAIKLSDGGPVYYRQRRVGRDGRVFQMLKFRSMVQEAEHLIIDLRSRNMTDGLLFKVPDDPRVTRTGRLIRKLSLDELPQLWNVLRGEMSLVGPRPLAVEPSAFGFVANKRHSVLPGITGYWQITGGNGLSYDEMIKLDLAYIENWSLWLDIRLISRTIPVVLHRRDA